VIDELFGFIFSSIPQRFYKCLPDTRTISAALNGDTTEKTTTNEANNKATNNKTNTNIYIIIPAYLSNGG